MAEASGNDPKGR